MKFLGLFEEADYCLGQQNRYCRIKELKTNQCQGKNSHHLASLFYEHVLGVKEKPPHQNRS
jgi:hypothetical protein